MEWSKNISEMESLPNDYETNYLIASGTLPLSASFWEPTSMNLPDSTNLSSPQDEPERSSIMTPKTEVPATEAVKYDTGKPDFTLVPIEAMEMMAEGFAYGARKYRRSNYRQSGLEWTRLAAACLRHVYQWLFVSTIDAESGCNHISLALCSLAMLAFQIKNHPETDNRNLKEPK